ncbi:MAG: hypothetical protein FWD11_08035 [Micrococcales bacterium]|nr:hypothetical protein [Micrococcales bacterium]
MDAITRRALVAQYAVTDYVTGTLKRMRRDDRGQGAVEYIGIIVLIAVLIAALVTFFQSDMKDAVGKVITDAIKNVGENIGK